MNAIDLNTLAAPKRARVEIIPLIDVIFFLLATFVLFTLSLDKITSLPVVLPGNQKAKDGPPEEIVTVQASANGTYYWKQGDAASEMISEAELLPRLQRYRQSVAEPKVFVRGDREAKFGEAIKALDFARAAGISRVSVETITSPTGG